MFTLVCACAVNCPTVGGKRLTILGQHFLPPVAILVGQPLPCFASLTPCCVLCDLAQIDAGAGTNVSMVSLTELHCDLPPGAGLLRAVVVSANNLQSPLVNLVSYRLPTITAITTTSASGRVCAAVGGNSLKLVDCPRNGVRLPTLARSLCNFI